MSLLRQKQKFITRPLVEIHKGKDAQELQNLLVEEQAEVVQTRWQNQQQGQMESFLL